MNEKMFSSCALHTIKNLYFLKCLGIELGEISFSWFILIITKERHQKNYLECSQLNFIKIYNLINGAGNELLRIKILRSQTIEA